MNSELKKLGVTCKIGRTCACSSGKTVYVYSLPIRVDQQIESALEPLGKSTTSFQKQSMVKINNSDFSLTAVNRLKKIKLMIKKIEAIYIQEQFENLLFDYIRKRKECL